jgi:hypothetical protein
MTDIQLLTAALAVIVPLSLLIYSNSRISDVNHRIVDLRGSVEEANETLRAELRALIERNHSEVLSKFAEMDSRLARI